MTHGIHYKNIFSYRYSIRFSRRMFGFESYDADTQLTKLARYSDECEYIADIAQCCFYLHELSKFNFEPLSKGINFNCPIGQ